MRRAVTASIAVTASAGAMVLSLASPAWAHVELDPGQIKANVATRIEMVVEHGCDASPISKVVTRLPPEAVDVNADGPTGWTAAVAANVVTWDGTAAPVTKDLRLGLTFTARAPAGAELALPTVESCPDGEEIRWIDVVPATADESVHPVPRLTVSTGDAPATTTAAPATAAPATTAAATTTSVPRTTPTTATTAGPSTTGGPAGGPTSADGSPSTTTAPGPAPSNGGGSGALVAVAGVLVAVAVVGGVVVTVRRRRGRTDDGA